MNDYLAAGGKIPGEVLPDDVVADMATPSLVRMNATEELAEAARAWFLFDEDGRSHSLAELLDGWDRLDAARRAYEDVRQARP